MPLPWTRVSPSAVCGLPLPGRTCLHIVQPASAERLPRAMHCGRGPHTAGRGASYATSCHSHGWYQEQWARRTLQLGAWYLGEPLDRHFQTVSRALSRGTVLVWLSLVACAGTRWRSPPLSGRSSQEARWPASEPKLEPAGVERAGCFFLVGAFAHGEQWNSLGVCLLGSQDSPLFKF